jgi:DNA methylase
MANDNHLIRSPPISAGHHPACGVVVPCFSFCDVGDLLAERGSDVSYTHRGDVVVDPFLGSGSTLIAAEKTGRVGQGVELDALYVDVIVRRYEAATDNSAVHRDQEGPWQAWPPQPQ